MEMEEEESVKGFRKDFQTDELLELDSNLTSNLNKQIFGNQK